jgi:hypothetical protein
MDTARSRDGTTIAFDRLGEGAPVILVSGASTTLKVLLANLLLLRSVGLRRSKRRSGWAGVVNSVNAGLVN